MFVDFPRPLIWLATLALALPPTSLAGELPVEDLLWVKVTSNQAATLDFSRADRILEYGSFWWVGVSRQEAAVLYRAGLEPASFEVTLGGDRFDPLGPAPSLLPEWDAPSEGTALRLVQFVGPTRQDWLESLRSRDLRVVQYIHPFTYVVWGPSLQGLENHPDVRWTGEFEPAFKVLPPFRNLGETTRQWSGLIYRGADVAETVDDLLTMGATDVKAVPADSSFVQVKFSLPGKEIARAAAITGIYTLKPQPTDGGLRGEMSNQICVNNHDGANLAFPGYSTWLFQVGLDGSGVTMANVDQGIYHTHPDLVGRMLPCIGSTCGGAATDAHGTHTAGIMAADGSSGVTDGLGFLRGLGVAPGATLVEQLYYSYPDANGLLNLIQESFANGAMLSGNSWGPSGSPLGYDDDTRQVDVGVRDADPATEENQEFTYVLSIMNGYGGTSSQGTPDEAKNIFTIGSTRMQSSGGSQHLDIFNLSSTSAHGPALDGRAIPHMVAPGCHVDSTISSTGHGVMCGTSMASPHVAGGVALFIERHRTLQGLDPSPALVKAAFLPVAHDLSGYLDASGGILGHPFDSKQGWGRMNLDAVVNPAVSVLYRDQLVILDGTGEEWSATWNAPNPTAPVLLMLVWTDAPGHGLGGSTPAWNNDLDLVVESAGVTYRGNQFAADGWSLADPLSPDPRNNTEGIFLPAGSTASFTVRVQSSNISSDGIPGQGDDTDQDFALVCYNCFAGLFADGFEDGTANAWRP